MKLYFSPSACSLSPHIVLREAGIPFDLERVDLREKRMKGGADFLAVNAKGYVPVLELDDGARLTEGAAMVQYIADQKPESKLAPANGTMERYRLQEWLNFIASEVHKTYTPLFYPTTPDQTKQASKEKLATRFDFIVKTLDESPYLMGDTYTVADAYLFTVLRWSQNAGVELAKWPALVAYMGRVGERPAVKAALAAEGLKG